MRRTVIAVVAALAALLVVAAPAGAEPDQLVGAPLEGPRVVTGPSMAAQAAVADGFEVVGHSPLGSRGMNAAIAVHKGHVYVGSRTDGRPHHLTPGIMVVDATDPASPAVVGEITEGLAGDAQYTSRELRVWPQQDLLIVLEFACSAILHACTPGSEVQSRPAAFELFDISAPATPRLIATASPSRTPHEFFLWVDPARPSERALLFWTAPSTSQTNPNLVVTDISAARSGGPFPEIPWVADFPAPQLPTGETADRRLHSIGVTPDGRTTYLAFLGAGFLVLDSSEIVDGHTLPQFHLLTPPGSQPVWANPGAHSAVPVPGTDTVLITDEVYGDAVDPVTGQDHGCPWGWVRFADASDPAVIDIVSEYRLPENDPATAPTCSPAATPRTRSRPATPRTTRRSRRTSRCSPGTPAACRRSTSPTRAPRSPPARSSPSRCRRS